MTKKSPLLTEVADLLITTLNLEMTVDDLDPDLPLFDETGLGLDSIDALELAFVISKEYGFQLRSDDENNEHIFRSTRTLTEHIEKNRVID